MDKSQKGQKGRLRKMLGIVRKVLHTLLISPLLCYRSRKTVTVIMCGQLGNQLFQYACGYAVAKRNHLDLRLSLRLLPGLRLPFQLHHFNICKDIDTHNTFTLLLCKIRFISPLVENPRMDFEPRVLEPQRKGLRSLGCWQHEQYFSDCASDIRTHLQITTAAGTQTKQLLSEIAQCCAVSVHVRRGDYVGSRVYIDLTPSYYQRACEYIAKRCGAKPTFYVFSDDPEWVAQHFLPQFIPHWDMRLASSPNISEIDDLRAMRACRHHIIANSTFSWWGAWLSPSENKLVVSPRKWFSADSKLSELNLPGGWVRL